MWQRKERGGNWWGELRWRIVENGRDVEGRWMGGGMVDG